MLVISAPITQTLASAETCESLYSNGLYEEALPLCLIAKDNFRLGYIYGTLNNCENMEKYYIRSGAPRSIGNIGIYNIYGSNGCEKDVQKGVKLLKEAIIAGATGFADILGDHYRRDGNFKMAKSYYLKSVNYKGSSEWATTRARESYVQLLKLYNEKEKKSFYLKK